MRRLKLLGVKYPLLVSVLVWTACGYSGRTLLPDHIKRIYIPTVENETTRSGIEQEITTALTEGFVSDGRLSVVSEGEADAMLRGVIVKYEKGPLTFDRAQTVDEFKVEIVLAVQFEDLRQGKVLWKEDEFRAWKSYVEGSEAGGEEQAFTGITARLASDIVSRTVEGW